MPQARNFKTIHIPNNYLVLEGIYYRKKKRDAGSEERHIERGEKLTREITIFSFGELGKGIEQDSSRDMYHLFIFL
jgi:hypothetical protein